MEYTVGSTRYRTRHFFNNFNTNEDIATKFEEEYVRCVRNEKECVCSVCLYCAKLLQHGAAVRQPAGFGSEWDTLYKLLGVCDIINFIHCVYIRVKYSAYNLICSDISVPFRADRSTS
jgi:hypothetical protein